ncbi:MAG TPA: heparinase II/III family protein [Oscillospiraceae bacterium]|nr:heparinase II/III family protein [Oscillospiraceae bacterium]HPF55777.1 heparinase II/III family protein [Clostridiales bacterium]HPK35848.1 heparinase II/III family protein [Oscillospiraceae bacterium]HPR76013.1 heparinase II/III family protein [Oscillospiraceae bacterium]
MEFFKDIKYRVLPFEDYKPFLDLNKGPADIPAAKQKILIEQAQQIAGQSIPVLPLSLYREFSQNGNRSNFQNAYFPRRQRLFALALGEFCEGKGKYITEIIDLIWAVCEETSWVISAHNVAKDQTSLGKPIPDAFGDDIVAVDLFSAATAATLAWVMLLVGDRIDAEIPDIIRERIAYEVNRRIIKPYLTYTMRWITDFVNNWVPWIVSNVLSVTALMVKDLAVREAVVKRSLEFLDIFTATYNDDGGCDEGAGYWNAAGAAWFDALEQLYDMTGGDIDIFGHEFTRKVGEYIMNMNIGGRKYVTFADAHYQLHSFDLGIVYRYGKRVGSDRLKNFAAGYLDNETVITEGNLNFFPHRIVKNFVQHVEPRVDYIPPKTANYDGMQVGVMRSAKLYTAFKGGHNNESHNHNDVGSFIVYFDEEPFLIDPGVGTYTRDTFNENRYKIWTMQSSWHNLPEIGGHMQHNGAEYKADKFTFDEEQMTASVSYKTAYEQGTGVKTCTREWSLIGDILIVKDHITCEKPTEVCWNFVLRDKPELIENGFKLNGHKLTADSPVKVELDRQELTDEALKKDWVRDCLYRVRITPEINTEYSIRFQIN